MFKTIINFVIGPYRRWKEKRRIAKRIEELRKRDPFIY
jgi:hypothetical protein